MFIFQFRLVYPWKLLYITKTKTRTHLMMKTQNLYQMKPVMMMMMISSLTSLLNEGWDISYKQENNSLLDDESDAETSNSDDD